MEDKKSYGTFTAAKPQVVKLFEHEDIWTGHQAEGEGPGPYCWAPRVKAAAQEIIRASHPHLEEANIAYLFRTGSWASRGKLVPGKASVVPALWRFVSGYDLVLVINELLWFNLTRKGRKALLDHQLSCFAEPFPGKDGYQCWETREQDIKEFSQVVKRHGICINSAQGLKELSGQMSLETLQDNVQEEESMGGEHYDEEDNIEEEGLAAALFLEEHGNDEAARENDGEVKATFNFRR